MTGYKGSIPERLSRSQARMGRGSPLCEHLREQIEKDSPDCYQHKVQKPASLMVWGCVSAHDMGNLHICEGTINAERYIQVLEQHMLPSKQRLFQGRPCLFQQDNAKPHSACVTTAWLRSKRVRVLDWPACSPDLSPIENVWRIMKSSKKNCILKN
uniref:Tc1-like transposase DDE domain-containing protein n=1 Tax=Pygocentrus nattereri TaxID=42514 RepID=A0AAR2KV54_PYGNA